MIGEEITITTDVVLPGNFGDNSIHTGRVSFRIATMALWIMHSPWNRKDLSSIPGRDRYIVAWMIT